MRHLPDNSQWWDYWLATAVLLALPFLLYGNSFDLWLTPDVSLSLVQAALYTPWEYFSQSDAYQLISYANLTPWLTATFDIDYRLFGFSIPAFRAHQLLSLGVSLWLGFHLMLRLGGSLPVAFFATCLVATSISAVGVAYGLNMRHYVEGLIFALLALLAFLRFGETARERWLLLSALAYLLALTAKEIYAPLPLVLFLSQARAFRPAGLWAMRYYVVVAVFYLLWRRHMLGEFIGGYDKEAIALQFSDYLNMVVNLPRLAFPHPLVLGGVAMLSLPVIYLDLRAGRTRGWLIAGVLIALLLPLMPLAYRYKLSANMNPRWFLLFAWCTALYLCWAISGLQSPRWRQAATVGLAGLVAVQCLFVTFPRSERIHANADQYYNRLAGLIWEGRGGHYLAEPGAMALLTGAHFAPLAYMKEVLEGRPATMLVSDPVIAEFRSLEAPSYHYRDGEFVPGEQSPAGEPDYVLGGDPEPARAAIAYSGGELHWDLSALTPKAFRLLVLDRNSQRYTVNYFAPSGSHLNFAWSLRGMGLNLASADVVVGLQEGGRWRYTRAFSVKQPTAE
jgi:hypothetical protein